MTTGPMRHLPRGLSQALPLALLALAAGGLAPGIARAQTTTPLPLSALTLNPPAQSGTAKTGTSAAPSAPTGKITSCAQFGPDFRLQPGTDTCVRMGAMIRMDAGTGRALSNAPNQGNNNTGMDTSSAYSGSDAWKTSR